MNHPTLNNLDDNMYPLIWQRNTYSDSLKLLMAICQLTMDQELNSKELSLNQKFFSDELNKNQVYQDWINFTLFGHYIHKMFIAFYNINVGFKDDKLDQLSNEMPDILYQELIRHGQYLPKNQTLFFSGDFSLIARKEKIFLTTLNPFTIISDVNKNNISIINHITVTGKEVLCFAIKHNKRLREHHKNEVMLLDFYDMRLCREKEIVYSRKNVILRHYELR